MNARWFDTPGRRPAAGFTLIELVVSGAVMSIILAAAYVCFNSGVATQRLVESQNEALQTARVAMAILTADLRAACPLSKEIQFLGMDRMINDTEADNLDFATHQFTPRRTGEGDFCEISYFLAEDPQSGGFTLWRRRNPIIAPEPLSGGKREEIARGVRGLRFEYYDGFDWYDDWGEVEGRGKAQTSWRLQPNLTGMPEAVRITLWLDADPRPRRAPTPPPQASPGSDSAEPPLVFQTVARLNLAPLSVGTGSGSGSSLGGAGSAGQSGSSAREGGGQ